MSTSQRDNVSRIYIDLDTQSYVEPTGDNEGYWIYHAHTFEEAKRTGALVDINRKVFSRYAWRLNRYRRLGYDGIKLTTAC